MVWNLQQIGRQKPLLLAFAAILLLGGCSREVAEQSLPSEPVLSRQYRQGSVTVVLSASETNISSTGQIRLVLDVQTPPATEVVFPAVGNQFEPFSVSESYSEPLQTLPNGKTLHRTVWKLVPGLPGTTVFQSLEIAAGPATIQTDPFPVAVRSILPEGVDAFEIRDIAAPATLLPEQRETRHRWLALAGLLGVAVLATLAIALARRPRKTVVLPPHETAFQALENLPEEPLERIHKLSEILLAFLGGRFGLPTHGKTVNEVMPMLPRKILLGRRHKLEAFLSEAEQIRFSNRVPPGFAGDYEAYVRGFVDEMKQEAPCG